VALTAVKTTSGTEATDRTEANERDGIIFPAFGESGGAGSSLRLGFDKVLPPGDISIAIFLFEDDLPPAGIHGEEEPRIIRSVETAWEYLDSGSWLPLSVKDDGTSALTMSGRVIVEAPAAMEHKDGLYWIRCRPASGAYEIPPFIERIVMNTVTALQIETVTNEDLGAGDGRPGQKKKIAKPPVYQKSQIIEISQNSGPWQAWEEMEDFEGSGPLDRHYIIDAETGEICFGNGLNGLVPAVQDRVRISYRSTLGSRGNIPEGQRFVIVAGGFSGISVANPEAAEGGEDIESIGAAQARARRELSIRYRAVTAGDFEAVALSTPGLRVARAKAIPNYNPRYPCVPGFPNWMTVVVMPVTRAMATPRPGPGFIGTVAAHLDRHRLVTTGVSVVAPKYVKISVSCTLKIRKRSSPSAVSALAADAINAFLEPLGGGPEAAGWPFGRPVYPSEIYQLLDAVEGVEYVTGVSVSAEGEYRRDGEIIKIPPEGLVYPGEHAIAAGE
jgi:predicted phage baseplate assembly protein